MKVMLDAGAYMPERAHDLDAGYDLRMPDGLDEVILYGGSAVIIDTGVHMAIPEGYVGFIKSKSGLNVKNDLTATGVVDAGYTGSIVVKLYNHGRYIKKFNSGDKLTQVVILPIFTPDLELVDSLDETERGDNGFGSTGV
jgi:dUTP pyrophosphatase